MRMNLEKLKALSALKMLNLHKMCIRDRIEVVSTCPTNWGMSATKAMEFVTEKMIPYYPLGVFKDIEEGK